MRNCLAKLELSGWNLLLLHRPSWQCKNPCCVIRRVKKFCLVRSTERYVKQEVPCRLYKYYTDHAGLKSKKAKLSITISSFISYCQNKQNWWRGTGHDRSKKIVSKLTSYVGYWMFCAWFWIDAFSMWQIKKWFTDFMVALRDWINQTRKYCSYFVHFRVLRTRNPQHISDCQIVLGSGDYGRLMQPVFKLLCIGRRVCSRYPKILRPTVRTVKTNCASCSTITGIKLSHTFKGLVCRLNCELRIGNKNRFHPGNH